MTDWTPLSVREGNALRKANWRFKGFRESLAQAIAPWYFGTAREWHDISQAWKAVRVAGEEIHGMAQTADTVAKVVLKAQTPTLRAAAEQALVLLGSGECDQPNCEGCKYDTQEARRILSEAIGMDVSEVVAHWAEQNPN